jgi:hypothetical protein
MYNAIIKRIVKKSFQLVNEHRYTQLVQGMALNVQHTFAGDHALGGSRNDQAAVKEWLERLGRIMPGLHLVITNIIVDGCNGRHLRRWKTENHTKTAASTSSR